MKIKKGFVVREIGGKSVAVATGAVSREFHGMVTLNHTGKFLFEALMTECSVETLTEKLMAEYEVDGETAKAAVVAFTDKLRAEGILEA